MSHLGTKILYGILNKHPRIACERAFSPWVDCEAQIRSHGLPLVTLESADPLGVFDVIGMSLQYELTYTNVLNIIDLAGCRCVPRTGATTLPSSCAVVPPPLTPNRWRPSSTPSSSGKRRRRCRRWCSTSRRCARRACRARNG